MKIEPMFITINDVTDATGISRSEIYRAMRDRRRRFHVVAGRRRIRPDDLRTYVRGETFL
jgi:excisionase family DNA binding protein